MFFEGKQSETILQPPKIMAGVLIVTAVPTLVLGIYWVPIADWVQRSLVFFIQTL